VLKQEKESTASTFGTTASTPHSVNVVVGIIGRVILNYPVNFRKVKAALSHICAKKNTCFCLAKFKIG
jgi:hypothetical protein